LSLRTEPEDVREQAHIDPEALMREIARYLAAVDAFRDELCEPTWLAELAPGGAARAGCSRGRKARAPSSRDHRA
jgi:hypothetical protein